MPGRRRNHRRALHVGLGFRRIDRRKVMQAMSKIRRKAKMKTKIKAKPRSKAAAKTKAITKAKNKIRKSAVDGPIYLTEADVQKLVTVKDAIATLERLFATWGDPSTINLPRQRARAGQGSFNLMGAAWGPEAIFRVEGLLWRRQRRWRPLSRPAVFSGRRQASGYDRIRQPRPDAHWRGKRTGDQAPCQA